MNKSKHQIFKFIHYFYASFFIGMIALEIGIILPFLMDEMSLNYSLAGGLLSAFAIGNLISSLLNPILSKRFTQNAITLFFSALLTFSLLILTFLPDYKIIYLIIILIGIGRGTINIYVYTSANNRNDCSPLLIHLISVFFAIGALTAPLITSFFQFFELNWKQIVYIFAVLSILVPVFILRSKPSDETARSEIIKDKNTSCFYKNPGFYILGGILFCYVGLENCINGWFIQYFKDTALMPSSYAGVLVSITWLLILFGRLTTAALSTKFEISVLLCINCIGSALFFILMVFSRNHVIITLSIGALGFFCAGIYPTCLSGSKKAVNNSSGMALLLAFSSLGGILVPQFIGIIADYIGLAGSILYLSIIMILMVSLSLIYYLKKPYKPKEKTFHANENFN